MRYQESLTKPRIPLAVNICIVGALVLIAAGFLELQGQRIIQSEVSLTEVWGSGYLLGTLRTASGALFMGSISLGIFLLYPSSRVWAQRLWPLIFGSGAAIFLIGIAGLVAWAP